MDALRAAAKSLVTRPLQWLESRCLREARELHQAPIFILSLPRSGSTLFYLLLTRYYALSYFSNLASRFPTAPTAVSLLARHLGVASPPDDLRAWYGNTPRWNSPSQAYPVWNRWLDPDLDYIEPDSLDARAVIEMRATVAFFQDQLGGPFCSKWQRHLPRACALAQAFPEAVFIYLERSPALTAQSLLTGRREFLGDEAAWLSVRPSDYRPTKDDDPLEQVCRQVHHLRLDAARYLQAIGSRRCYATSYESFCDDPRAVLVQFGDWYRRATGARLEQRPVALPRLSRVGRPKVTPREFARITERLACLASGPATPRPTAGRPAYE